MSDASASSQPETNASYFDGLDNHRRSVRLRLGAALEIFENSVLVETWPLETIHRADGLATELRLRSSSSRELARIAIVDGRFRSTLIDRCPALYKEVAGAHGYARIVAWSLAAAASILAVTIYGIPFLADRFAPLVPVSIEKRIGDMVDGQVKKIFNAEACASPDGSKAFAKMMQAISGAGNPDLPVDAKVIRSGVRNAIALPGGKVYLFRGLLDKANNVDEIAGVLSHELGHVKNHDGMRRMIQAGGTSFLVGLLFGDVTGSGAVIFVTQQLIDASYSREAESRADGVAIDVMNGLGASPVPMGELMQRITGDQRDSIGILASHPLTGDRLDRFKKEWRPATGKAPILDADEWKALQAICGAPRKDDDKDTNATDEKKG